MRPENISKPKGKAYLLLLAAILILSACNSTKQTADYPNFYSPHQKKTETRFALKLSPRKSSVKDTSKVTQLSIPIAESKSKATEVKSLPPEKALYKRYIQLITGRADIQAPVNNEGTLTASLSAEPVLTRHIFSNAIARVHSITASDTTKNKIAQSQPTGTKTDEQADLKKQKRLKAFAIVSLVAGLLSIVTLAFLPGVFLLLAAAAIVFGALGLKSAVKKYRAMAIAGMVTGIVLIALFLIVLIAFFASGGLYM